MAREDLYVAMSRGRDLNHTYIALDQPDPDCPPGHQQPQPARDVLTRILATSHAEVTATETWRTYHPDEPAPTPARQALQAAAMTLGPTTSLSATRYTPTPAPGQSSPAIGL